MLTREGSVMSAYPAETPSNFATLAATCPEGHMTETRRMFVFHFCSIVMSRHFSKSEYLMMCNALDRGNFMLVSQSNNERYCTTGNIMNNTVTEKWRESIGEGSTLFISHQHQLVFQQLQIEGLCCD